MLPFTRDQFLAVFVAYNEAAWPAQVLAFLLGLLMVALIIWPSRQRSRVVAAGLAAMWLWTGVAHHGMHFTPISAEAWSFGALFWFKACCSSRLVLREGATPLVCPRAGPAGWPGRYWHTPA
jgi:hypothetical protein